MPTDSVDLRRREKWIDTASSAERLRSRIIDVERQCVLISRIAESGQEPDLSVPANCKGFGRIHHFRRRTAVGWPLNPLPIDPACRALGIGQIDLLRVQAFQNAACPWRCWYCFVPYEMLSGNPRLGAWMSAEELVDLYMAELDRPSVIDLTGGSPDLTPEWVMWMMRALRSRGLERSVYLWSDDNLSTDFYWRYLTPEARAEMAAYPMYGRVACFKGFDARSFAFNTHADPSLYESQFELMRRLVADGLDCYCYATFTAETDTGVDEAMHDFMDRLQRIHHNLPLRTVPLRIESFSPVKPRLSNSRRQALAIQDTAITAWNAELCRRFSATERGARIDEVAIDRR